jgi:hypothetical protein
MTATTPESAVRQYLQWVQDPGSAVDQDAVARAEAAVAAASDPLAKLHALADLDHARQADGERITEDFIAHAKAYADAESIPVAAFQQLGVPSDVLARAGFSVGRGTGRRGPASTRQRAPQVPIDQLKAAALSLPKQFTLSDVTDKAGGGSPATVRKAVEELVHEGKAARIGPKPNHSGRGRAPIVYELR